MTRTTGRGGARYARLLAFLGSRLRQRLDGTAAASKGAVPPAQRQHGLWKVPGLRKPRTRQEPPVSLRSNGPRPPRLPVRRYRSPSETGSRPATRPPSTTHPRRFHAPPTTPTTTGYTRCTKTGDKHQADHLNPT